MWVVHIPLIKDRTGVADHQLGLLLLVLGVAAWIGMQAAGPLTDRFGSRAVVVTAMVAMGFALPLPGLAHDQLSLAGAVVVLGAMNGFVDVAQNAQAVQVEQHWGRAIMSSFHAFFSAGGLVAALSGGALLALGVSAPVALAGGGGVTIAAALALRPLLLPPESRHDEANDLSPRTRPPWTGRVLLIGGLAFVLMLSEGVAFDWSTVHVRDHLGASASTAALAFGAFSVAMTAVRLFADLLVRAWGPGAFVRRAATLGALGFAVTVLAPDPALALVGWAVVGIGLAGCAPQFYSAAGNVDRRYSGVYLARAVGMGYLGLLAGPSVIGAISSAAGLDRAFLVPLAGCLVAAVLAPRALRHDRAR
ncbi:MFS transporter [Aeromicrobium phragmitis]|uniref:MFS transporter n=2 Tax=Aeromicrobium phragmitis TaxID=2478914 RepID=A0A3L8PID5_9ACTN|nr:MFS transporter [Aeromicrobium phragmitis]